MANALTNDFQSCESSLHGPLRINPHQASLAGRTLLLSKPDRWSTRSTVLALVIVYFAMQVVAPDPRKSSMSSYCGGIVAGPPRAKSHISVK
jgi:hypothetical protein